MKFLSKLMGHRNANSGAIYQRRYLAVSEAARAHEELQRDLALAGISDAHPVWQAVLSLVDETAQGELEAALAPNLTNEQRQYTAGAAAAADYIAQKLRDARLLAQQRMAKQKNEE